MDSEAGKARDMRLLLVNPNISIASTEAFLALAGAAASPATSITGVAGRFGVDLMSRPAELAIGIHAMLDVVADRIDEHDALIIAAFGDYGADAAASLFRKPIMTLADAAFAAVRLSRCRYSILAPAPGFETLMAALPPHYGAAETLIAVRSVNAKPADAGYADAVDRALEETVAADAPDAVLMVGPPLAPHVARLRDAFPVQLIEGVSCAVRLTEAHTLVVGEGLINGGIYFGAAGDVGELFVNGRV
jgi:Asp/Glu/hydantoin racemase